jgi:hypothetical protein
MTAKTSNFSNLIYYNPAGPGFNAVPQVTMYCPDNMDEGDTMTVDLVTWGIPDGTVLAHTFPLTNIGPLRFNVSPISPVANNRASFTLTVSADNTTASGAQSFDIQIRKTVTGTVLASKTVSISDTSQTATYTLTSDASIDEGGGLTFTASGTNVPDGGYYWTIETGSGDFTTTSGSLGITDNYGSFIVVPNADATTEGNETFTVALRSGSISGPILVTSAAITINDTSQDQQLLVMDLDPMNYTSGSSISDASGQNNNGTLVGSPVLTTGGTNGASNYFTLNGTSQYIVVPSLQNSAYRSVTMMLWFNSSSPQGSLITKELSYKMRLSSNHLNVMATDSGSAPWDYNSTDNSITFDNNWHHVAVTIAPDFIDWYYDGNNFHHEGGIGNLGANTQQLMIGSYGSGTSEFFTGMIGPARLYNYALSSSDISAYFNSTRSRYQVEEPYSLTFNGTSDFYEVLGLTSQWALELDWTIEFWSKANGASGNLQTVMSQYNDLGGIGIDIYYENGSLCIDNTRGPICAEPTPGVWTHVALVCNGGGNDLNVFYNGVNVYNGGGYYLGLSTATLVIGKRGQIPFQHLAGKLTGIRITNTAIYTGAFNPYTQALPPTKVTGTKLLMNPTDVNTLVDLSDSLHSFSGNSGSGDDHPALTGFHTYKAVTPFNGTSPGQVYFLRSEYPGIESVPIGATMTSTIFANPNAPVTITGSQVWVNQLYWVLTYSDPGGTSTTVPGDTFTITW